MKGDFVDKRRWRRLKARVLMERPLCEACAGITPSAHVDHIIPRDKGGALYDVANLQALCVSCHSAKTACDKVGREWIKPKHRGCNIDGSPREQSLEHKQIPGAVKSQIPFA